jgi:hypothetical protein
MKYAIWITGAMLAALWTGLCWMGSLAFSWLGEQLGTGMDVDAVLRVTQMPLPSWVTVWLDPVSLQWMRDGLAWLATQSAHSGPWLATLIGAAGWLIWPVWVLGFVVLLLLVVGAHWAVGRVGGAPGGWGGGGRLNVRSRAVRA